MKTKAQSLIALFGWFQVPPNKPEGTKEKLMAQFEYIARNFTDTAVFNAVEDFVNGRVDKQSGTWLPEPTAFGMQCRVYAAYDDAKAKRERIAREGLAMLPAPQQQSLEERQAAHERIMGNANQFFDGVANERLGRSPEMADVPENGFKRDYSQISPPKDPRPIEERLNIRDTRPAFYPERETIAAGGFDTAGISADDVLNGLGVRVESDEGHPSQPNAGAA